MTKRKGARRESKPKVFFIPPLILPLSGYDLKSRREHFPEMFAE